MKRGILFFSIAVMLLMTGCLSGTGRDQKEDERGRIKVTVFAAKSLNQVLDTLAADYEKDHPEIEIVGNYDSSGTLMTQIKEGASCDVFFSADTKQMDALEEMGGIVISGTRHDLLNNQVCVVTYKGSNTKVTGLENMNLASSLAIASGSVPVGKYTRQALVNAGLLERTDDVLAITTEQIAKALGNNQINECGNVGAVTTSVVEGANEVGTVYYSDTYGLNKKLEILQKIPNELTGNVIYPVAQIENQEADQEQKAAAADFIKFLTGDHARDVFRQYLFDVTEKPQ